MKRKKRPPGNAGVPPASASLPSATLEPRGWHFRGYLPHFDGGAIPQMVTFRLAGTLPSTVLARWNQELNYLGETQKKSALRRRLEAYLDQETKDTPLRNPQLAAMVEDALLYFANTRYHLHAWVVMPTHVHVLFAPLAGHAVSTIIHSWKSFTAHQAVKRFGCSAPFWSQDYFDRFIRNERHFTAAIAYIEANPVKAGLCQRNVDWRFSSAYARVTNGNDGYERES
ncbi:MAG: transposase [Chloroflexota bacterium]|nr:transposase [Chloroflexota bacterium]MDE2929885.1 transposase [Chloroflexota bacterium]